MVTSQLSEILSKFTYIDRLYDPDEETPPTILLYDGFVRHLIEHDHIRDLPERVLISEEGLASGYPLWLMNTSAVGEESPGYSALMKVGTEPTKALFRELHLKYEKEVYDLDPRLYSLFEDVYILFEKKFCHTMDVIKSL